MWICYYTDITNQLTTRLTLISIASARRTIPDVKIIMIHPSWHELDSDILRSIDIGHMVDGLPKAYHYDYRRCMANSEIEGDCLFLDTDTVIQKDLSNIWKNEFDIAVARRDKIFDPLIPYNMGVCFSRKPEFWRHVALQIPKYSKGYIDPERAFSRVCSIKDEYNLLELPGRLYNHTPDFTKQDVSSAYIVHYKGTTRKNIMLKRESEFIS